MESCNIKHEGKEIELTSFDVPMFHEDFHKAEEAGLVYAFYERNGPDYWDDKMVFCKPEDKEDVLKWDALYW